MQYYHCPQYAIVTRSATSGVAASHVPFKRRVLRTSRTAFRSLPFLALRNSCAYDISIADGGEFLRLISNSSNLESISIDVYTTPSPQELYTFLTTLHRSISRDTLMTISLYTNSDVDQGAPPSHSIGAHTLLPLLQCPNVKTLSIDIDYGYEATLMEAMALASHLRIYFYLRDRAHSRMNLGGILYLAQHWRALGSFKLKFDVSLPNSWMDSETRLASIEIRNEDDSFMGWLLPHHKSSCSRRLSV